MFSKHLLTACTLIAFMLVAGQVSAQDAQSDGGSDSSGAPHVTDRIGMVQGQKTSLNQVNSTAVRPSQKKAPSTHTVVQGDTLWDLSETYMSDPFKWPALWSYNPQVTNPHWIYPGDTIYLAPSSEEAAQLTTVPNAGPSPVFVSTNNIGSGVIIVPGYYVTELPKNRGHILYSDQEKNMLSPGDEVQIDWVDIENRKKFSNGQRFTVFQESKPVNDENGDPLAYKLIRLGSIELIDRQDKALSTAKIIQGSREIERGNLIIPNDDLMFVTKTTPNSKSMEGRIVDTMEPISQLAAEQYVIINRGTSDGVSPGNRWVIFEQREGLDLLKQGKETHTQYASEKDRKSDDDENRDPRDGELERETDHSWVLGHPPYTPQFPERDDLSDIYGDREYTTDDLPLRKIGEVLVIDAKDKFCTGIIMGSTREIAVDTRVVMINGY
ncbi:MAG: LysM peptidoglycan-binding domain-containing protein [Proteobacteria bacterium]|nr:LysM peptidoglycan-binding domain-containing protein [Pseudomonadota bacterium]